MTCEHFKEGICLFASELAKTNVPIVHQHCQVCFDELDPRGINRVTVSLAFHYAEKDTKAEILRRHSHVLTEFPSGPGTELKKLLSWFVSPKKRCMTCADRVRKMNKWGPEKCRKRKHLIVAWLKQSARKNKLPFNRTTALAFIGLAISNSERKMK